jgi:N-carbamoyl-L-amino-acid hydrolase
LAAASEAILALERICRDLEGVIGTIGRIEVFPNSLNVVPGAVSLGMDLRSLSDPRAKEAGSLFQKALEEIQDKRGVAIHFELETSSNPVIFDSNMVDRMGKVCRRLNIPYQEMPSGAGHDANHMADLAPVGMVFVPSKDGRSHCPEEWTECEHVGLGTEVLAWTIASIDQEVSN